MRFARLGRMSKRLKIERFRTSNMSYGIINNFQTQSTHFFDGLQPKYYTFIVECLFTTHIMFTVFPTCRWVYSFLFQSSRIIFKYLTNTTVKQKLFFTFQNIAIIMRPMAHTISIKTSGESSSFFFSSTRSVHQKLKLFNKIKNVSLTFLYFIFVFSTRGL